MPDTPKRQSVRDYIASCPKDAQPLLNATRAAIKKAAPSARERMDYFDMPGYSLDLGYSYAGMFAWFSYKKPCVRLHVRPPAIHDFADDVAGYRTTKSIISFSVSEKLPLGLIRKLIKRSIALMKSSQ